MAYDSKQTFLKRNATIPKKRIPAEEKAPRALDKSGAEVPHPGGQNKYPSHSNGERS